VRSCKITPKASSHQQRHVGKERLPRELPHVGKERPSGVAQEGRVPAAADHGHRGPTVANGGCIGTVVPSSLKKMVRSSFELQCNEDEQSPFLPVEGLVSRRVSDLLVRVLIEFPGNRTRQVVSLVLGEIVNLSMPRGLSPVLSLF
jgi:hypothetical protein